MTRAYLRLDPAFDEKKESYPDGPYAAFIACLCQAELQPERGRFRNERYLRALLGTRGRHVPYLVEHGDLVRQPDGRLYLDGWDEWQEGDWKVTERVRRIRSRRKGDVTAAATVDVTPDVTVDETVDVTAGRRARVAGATAAGVIEAVGGRRSGAVGVAERAAVTPPGRPRRNGATGQDDPYDEAVRWLAERKAWSDSPKIATELGRLVDRKGLLAVIEAMAAVPGAEDAAQFVYGARNALFPLAGSRTTPKADDPDPAYVEEQLAERRRARKEARSGNA